MYKICKKGVAINFLSSITPFDRHTDNHFLDPTTALQKIIYPITHNFVLRHDYRENDFTIYLYKEKK